MMDEKTKKARLGQLDSLIKTVSGDMASEITGKGKEKEDEGEEMSEGMKKGMEVESKEHPELPKAEIHKLVMDHLKEDPEYYDDEEDKDEMGDEDEGALAEEYGKIE